MRPPCQASPSCPRTSSWPAASAAKNRKERGGGGREGRTGRDGGRGSRERTEGEDGGRGGGVGRDGQREGGVEGEELLCRHHPFNVGYAQMLEMALVQCWCLAQ